MAQRRKHEAIGDTTMICDAANCLVGGDELSAVGLIFEASEAEPFLLFWLEMDCAVLADLMISLQTAVSNSNHLASRPALDTSRATLELIDLACCASELPSDAAILAPLVEMELPYRLLVGPQGTILRQIAHSQRRLNQINRALRPLCSDGFCRFETFFSIKPPDLAHRVWDFHW